MLMSLAAPGAGPLQPQPKRFGLIADRPSTLKPISANGKSSITVVNAKRLGGLGAAIALPLTGAAAPPTKLMNRPKTPSNFELL